MRRLVRSLPALASVLALAALTAAGCAKKVAVDQIGTLLVAYPEGHRGTLENTPSDLVVWQDAPNEVLDNFTAGGSYLAYRTSPGAIQGMVFDYLQAGGYHMFRRESGGGYRMFSDFVIPASRRWSDRGYFGTAQGTQVLPPGQLFTFSDPAPPPIALAGYVGRAVVSGYSSAGYPLTNLGETTTAGAIPPLNYTGAIDSPDSLIRFQWDAVAGAAGYWVHVFLTRPDIQSGGEAIAIGLPSPVAIGKVSDLFVGFIPAPATSYKLGDALPVGGRALVYRVIPALNPVLVRVSAVDPVGRMIATIGANGDFGAYREEVVGGERFRTFPLGAMVVTPERPPPPPDGPLDLRGPEEIDSGVRGLTYIRTSAPRFQASR